MNGWITLPDTGAEVLFSGVPLIMRLPPDDDETGSGLDQMQRELEALHGWRVDLKTVRGVQSPKGWMAVVEWCGRLAVPFEYADLKTLPIASYYPLDGKAPWCKLTGLPAYSIVHQLSKPALDQPAGTYVVWRSSGALGIVRKVGIDQVVCRLVDALS